MGTSCRSAQGSQHGRRLGIHYSKSVVTILSFPEHQAKASHCSGGRPKDGTQHVQVGPVWSSGSIGHPANIIKQVVLLDNNRLQRQYHYEQYGHCEHVQMSVHYMSNYSQSHACPVNLHRTVVKVTLCHSKTGSSCMQVIVPQDAGQHRNVPVIIMPHRRVQDSFKGP